MKYYNVVDFPFEMFETIFYNVPNELYKDLSFDSAKKILEYLQQKEIKTYISTDELDKPFFSKYKSLSGIFAKRAIKTLYKLVQDENNKIFKM